jgi:DNA polymerase III alpha subunit
MQWPFEHDIYEGEFWLATIEGIATIEENTGSGIHDDWTVSKIQISGVRERGKWEFFTLSDTSELYETILLQILNEDRHDIDDEWATYIVEARIGNRADEQRDNVISFGLHS